MRERLNLCKTIVGIVKNSVGVVSRVKLFLLALFFLFHTTTFAYFPICCGCFLAFLVVAYPDISFFIFLWVRTFSYITYCGFSTLLFTENVPRHFIFYISLGTLLNCLTYFPPPLCTKGYRVALASTRYPSTNSLTFYIHISIYQYSHFYISIFTFLYINIHPYCLPFRLSFGIRLLFASMNIFPIYAVIFIYVLILDINSEFVGRLFSLPSSNSRLSSTTLSVHATSIACLMAFSTL